MSSRYHSKSGAGTAEASHLSEAFLPVVASLLLDSVIVGGSVEKTGTLLTLESEGAAEFPCETDSEKMV